MGPAEVFALDATHALQVPVFLAMHTRVFDLAIATAAGAFLPLLAGTGSALLFALAFAGLAFFTFTAGSRREHLRSRTHAVEATGFAGLSAGATIDLLASLATQTLGDEIAFPRAHRAGGRRLVHADRAALEIQSLEPG